jgi:hypothetical protein
MALSADTAPHFTTIANFVSTLSAEITEIFRNVLLVCDEAGLIAKEMFAVDGVKLREGMSSLHLREHTCKYGSRAPAIGKLRARGRRSRCRRRGEQHLRLARSPGGRLDRATSRASPALRRTNACAGHK